MTNLFLLQKINKNWCYLFFLNMVLRGTLLYWADQKLPSCYIQSYKYDPKQYWILKLYVALIFSQNIQTVCGTWLDCIYILTKFIHIETSNLI